MFHSLADAEDTPRRDLAQRCLNQKRNRGRLQLGPRPARPYQRKLPELLHAVRSQSNSPPADLGLAQEWEPARESFRSIPYGLLPTSQMKNLSTLQRSSGKECPRAISAWRRATR